MSDARSTTPPPQAPPETEHPDGMETVDTLAHPSELWSPAFDAWATDPAVHNPLRSGPLERMPAPCAMVIFGVSGDLTARKLMPSLYDLAVGQPLPEGFAIVGVSHRDWSEATFKTKMREAVAASARTPVTEDAWQGFAKGL